MESKIFNLVTKYDVEIDIKFKKKIIIATVSDGFEVQLLKGNWVNNLIEDIEKVCKVMFINRKSREKEVDKRLASS